MVLIRSAYNRAGMCDEYFPRHGIAVVVQDCRGRYEGEGEFYPFVHEAADGEDTLAWIGSQSWCNGRIGMYGDSYLAATQFALGATGSPLLAALNPRFMSGDCWRRAYYCDGAFSLGLTWSWLCFECASRVSHASAMRLFEVDKLLRTLPLLSLDERSGAGVVPSYRDYVRRSRYDAGWHALNISHTFGQYRAPVLLTGGWYDYYPAETIRMFHGLVSQAPNAELAGAHRLIIGPWTHGVNGASVLGEVDFGEEALRENDATRRWLHGLLTGGVAAEFQAQPVRYFTMGINRWRDARCWPPPGGSMVDFHLREGGRLSRDAAGTTEGCDRYVHDPADPVPTVGGNHSIGPYNPGLYELAKPGPYDQGCIQMRPDVLTYRSDVLQEDTEVTGEVMLELFASTSACDTDFVAKLIDLHPDGRAMNITEGIIRGRFREGIHIAPKLLEPGRVYAFTIDLQVTSMVFKAGHRIGLIVCSSNFPLWDRNLNTGGDPATETRMVKAEQAIWHSAERGSRLRLRIMTG